MRSRHAIIVVARGARSAGVSAAWHIENVMVDRSASSRRSRRCQLPISDLAAAAVSASLSPLCIGSCPGYVVGRPVKVDGEIGDRASYLARSLRDATILLLCAEAGTDRNESSALSCSRA